MADRQTTYSSRKFLLACFAMGISSIGLFTGDLDGGTWVAALSLVLGLYAAANVMEKRNGARL
jgi:hypothetical protein